MSVPTNIIIGLNAKSLRHGQRIKGAAGTFYIVTGTATHDEFVAANPHYESMPGLSSFDNYYKCRLVVDADCICGDLPPGGYFPKGNEPPNGCPIHDPNYNRKDKR